MLKEERERERERERDEAGERWIRCCREANERHRRGAAEPMEDADTVHPPGPRLRDGRHCGGAARAHLHAQEDAVVIVVGREGGGGRGASARAARPGAQGRRLHARRPRAVLPRQRQAARR